MPHREPIVVAESSVRDLVGVLVTLAAIVFWDIAGADLTVSRAFGNAQGFPWHEHWLIGTVVHEEGRTLAGMLLVALVLNLWWPFPFARGTTSRERAWWLGTTVACMLLIALLRRASLTSCPWSLREFGGTARHVSHWAFGVSDGGPGRCFPSAHASSAFAAIGGWLALRRSAPRAATVWLVVTLLAGATIGMVQTMRGAHFVSHALWTAWFCQAASVSSWHALRRWRGPVPDANPAAAPSCSAPA